LSSRFGKDRSFRRTLHELTEPDLLEFCLSLLTIVSTAAIARLFCPVPQGMHERRLRPWPYMDFAFGAFSWGAGRSGISGDQLHGGAARPAFDVYRDNRRDMHGCDGGVQEPKKMNL
jgi:hypothetical protein